MARKAPGKAHREGLTIVECSVADCPEKPHAHGLCDRHYRRWLKHGDPEILLKTHRPQGMTKPELVAHEVAKAVPDGDCLLAKSTTPKGYRQVRFAGHLENLHRLVLEVKLGRELRPDEEARHTCHIPSCIAEAHLIPGTHRENMRDREEAGRGNQPKGVRNGNAKLTEAQVREIRRRHAGGEATQKMLAGEYGVAEPTVNNIVTGRTWRHLDGSVKKAPGRSHREGMTLVELFEMFPTEEAATEWFESVIWAEGRYCPKCGSTETKEVPNAKPMPYWCKGCRSYFSVRTGTPIARSNVPLRKWAIAIYLCLTSLKSVSSMKLHRDIGVSQPTAWFMMQRIREAWGDDDDDDQLDGPVEADETFVGGKRKNMSHARRRKFKGAGPAAGKTAVIGVKDRESGEVRAEVIENTDGPTLQGFVREHVEPGATLYTDEARAYKGMAEFDHEAVNHSVGEYVDGMAHTNGMESFWSMLKRAHKGTFHKISPKHLDRYVREFAGKHNIRDEGTLAQMRDTVARLVGRNLLYRDLIADNGLSNAGRS